MRKIYTARHEQAMYTTVNGQTVPIIQANGPYNSIPEAADAAAKERDDRELWIIEIVEQ